MMGLRLPEPPNIDTFRMEPWSFSNLRTKTVEEAQMSRSTARSFSHLKRHLPPILCLANAIPRSTA